MSNIELLSSFGSWFLLPENCQVSVILQSLDMKTRTKRAKREMVRNIVNKLYAKENL